VPKGGWEKAREETRKREEERKAREAERKRKEEDEKRLKEAREREAREREVREREAREREARLKEVREREAREREARARLERIEKEKLEKERERERERVRELEKREKEEREKREKERKEKEEREKKAKEEKEKAEQAAKVELEAPKYKGSTYAFSSVGEKTNPWPRGQPPAAAAAPRSVPPPSPKQPPPPPTARTYLGTDDDAYSYRPYDKPRTPHKKSASSIYSESSYAASQSTSRTTPPPSHRGPYTTNDPDKIVIKAVYSFTNAFTKTPTSQLVSGTGSVTDGLILRITTEGLFIDDDVRGVPQREWDVKAWTMKLVEVYCPLFRQGSLGSNSTPQHAQNPVRRLWGDAKNRDKVALNEDADALLVRLLGMCKASCRLGTFASAAFDDDGFGSEVNTHEQNGEHKASKLHVLRASIRDQEGKRYVFVLGEEEGWKVAVGLQRLRKGTQVRALGVSGMSTSDSRGMLENLGWV
jgi:chemotaxis protein histidine kinase CheA